jgi:hypothetical protein
MVKTRTPQHGIGLRLIGGAAVLLSVTAAGAGAPAVDYEKQIQPILRSSCYSCHSSEKPAANLRLDTKSGGLAGGRSGKAIVPGNASASLLIQRLVTPNPKLRMPLGGTPLPAAKIELIRAWIREGAPWPEQQVSKTHWSYVKPVRPDVPKVDNPEWVRNPIDAFILARLAKEGLKPSPEASRETLIRRVSLDLIGLPPTPKEVDEFIADKTTDAYEKLVNRLLASPRYGERWARPWLDLARYADTNGFEADRSRSIWKYRDWVIDAFNADMPYDQFTIEQIAGDMLPDATAEQRIATGFHRNTMFNEEGGVDKEEAHFENLIDRVNTTATVWLGSTLGCAQCHDHKYDPFKQKEYYQFLAFFNNSERKAPATGNITQKFIEPKLELPTAEQEAARKKLQSEVQELELRVKTPTPELAREQAEWERSVSEAVNEWTVLKPERTEAAAGTILSQKPDGGIIVSGANPGKQLYVIEARTDVSGITGIRLEALPDSSLPRGGPGRDVYGNFFLTAFEIEAAPAAAPDRFEKIQFQEIIADDGKINDKKFRQLWSVDASREEKRLPRQIVFETGTPFGKDATILRIRLRQESVFGGQAIGHFRLSVTSAAEPTRIVDVSHKQRPVLAMAESERTAAQQKDLATFFRSIAPSLKGSRRRLTDLKEELDDLGIASTLVMGEQPSFERPSAYTRVRGAFLSKGDLVYANTPAVLPGLPDTELPNRLGLARWLVNKENPLTARVAVNRFWEQFFGRGIVETSEDFGTQGARPTHPELLDWLATEFMNRGWSMKKMHKLIVTSATYQQSSTVTPQLLERDPENRLLARGARFRMEGEMIRDVALAASGLLSSKIGGPSVFPYQPEGIWDLPYNDDKWVESKGEDRYRRGIYTFLRRTAPFPMLLNFDAPSREICTVRRVRTNTPLQALTALNDRTFFESAVALARRVIAEAEQDEKSRAQLAFRLTTGRIPKPGELDGLLTWQDSERRFFEQHKEEAKQMTGVPDPELAAWTMVSNVLLNLDEALTKE